jgi:hypothetical protein
VSRTPENEIGEQKGENPLVPFARKNQGGSNLLLISPALNQSIPAMHRSHVIAEVMPSRCFMENKSFIRDLWGFIHFATN